METTTSDLLPEVSRVCAKGRVFSLQQARELLPLVRRVTVRSYERVSRLTSELRLAKGVQRRAELKELAQDEFRKWREAMVKLGVEPKGPWIVDFDRGDGYYCWRSTEPDITHSHSYDGGFQGRQPLE